MTGLSRGSLLTMMALQAGMNAKVNPAWLAADYPFLRAVVVEGAEALEHHGWKWWKKQEPDMEQLRIELVDIWHFALSDAIQRFEGNHEAAANEILGDFASDRESKGTVFNLRVYGFATTDLVAKIEIMIGQAAARRFSFRLFESIMLDAGMDWESLHVGYVSKNVLNFFRQDHGYKAGTYIKIWNGREDNVVLAEIAQALDKTAPDFGKNLYEALEGAYATVLISHQLPL